MKTSVINLRDKKAEPRSRGIIFSAPMVRAILAGKKTQTRRMIKPRPAHTPNASVAGDFWYWKCPRLDAGYCHTNRNAMERLMLPLCPYGKVGDELWVRETWCYPDPSDRRTICFKASNDPVTTGEPWRSPIHLRQVDARIRLRITGIRVERVNEISEGDARAEGVKMIDDGLVRSYSIAFSNLWDMINGIGSFYSNPWAWVIEFARVAEGGKP